ncbi:hypothetical protein P691DRAFT_519260 [Macrolepiota fuliginosa MF-IS2]|uniref:Uncharacterized protein n=1 Tax=Macrolepiota fuliginosa MF-IS2 TaxID=1400762 RepID=A0A9P5WZW5_9AGAR|nr:hypothetical protein P691DRAFT_519260 [Macrolepiota fuliginosa MF-IS2]
MKNNLEWDRYEEVNNWVIRPLLRISKDRLLLICEKNQLSYVTNPTNVRLETTKYSGHNLGYWQEWAAPQRQQIDILKKKHLR